MNFLLRFFSRSNLNTLYTLAFGTLMSCSIGTLFFPGTGGEYFAQILVGASTGIGTVLISRIFVELGSDIQQEKEKLIFDLGSNDCTVTKRAAFDLWRRDWLIDKTLRGQQFDGANLEGVDFYFSHFGQTSRADLQGAILGGACLKNANLKNANLRYVHLKFADLTGANLENAILEGALLAYATLPDGTKFKSTSDIERFSDREHPNFWRSSDPSSPAYDK